MAGLLMFGDERAIIDEFPKYFLDYREKMSDDVRWDYRIISSEGTWSGNIYDFYFKIINKITDDLNVPFKLVNGIRQEETRVHEAVREAVANSLIHADYRLPRGIVSNENGIYSCQCAALDGFQENYNESQLIDLIGLTQNTVNGQSFYSSVPPMSVSSRGPSGA